MKNHAIDPTDDGIGLVRFERRLATRAIADPAVASFLSGTFAREEDGSPSICWRGQHGSSHRELVTRRASLSFGSHEAACLYATTPNDSQDVAEAPSVSPWLLRIVNPAMNDPSDPFIDMGVLMRCIGREAALDMALRASERIVDTGHWIDTHADLWDSDVAGLLRWRPAALDDLYMVAFAVFDDPIAVSALRRAGYDGAICGGYGDNALETEWRLFDASGALPALCPARGLAPSAQAA